jgi:hypothetical protein
MKINQKLCYIFFKYFKIMNYKIKISMLKEKVRNQLSEISQVYNDLLWFVLKFLMLCCFIINWNIYNMYIYKVYKYSIIITKQIASYRQNNARL